MPASIEEMEPGVQECFAEQVGVAFDWKEWIGGTPEQVDRDVELGQLLVEVMALLKVDPQ
jgi:hypothetical protein